MSVPPRQLLEKRATIVGIYGQQALVEADQASGCEQCDGKGCGSGKLARLFCSKPRQYRVHNPINASIGKEVISATFKAFRSLQRVVVVDRDVNPYDAVDVDWAITTRFNPATDLLILPDQNAHILNPIVQTNADGKGTITKVGIDALVPFGANREHFTRVQFKQVDLASYDIKF